MSTSSASASIPSSAASSPVDEDVSKPLWAYVTRTGDKMGRDMSGLEQMDSYVL
ncbi:hypothetical protein OROHE_012756 [Orobanche hederae]